MDELVAIINADGEQHLDGDVRYEVTVMTEDGDQQEVISFWSTVSQMEQDLVEALIDNGYDQTEALDWSDAPYCTAKVQYV